MNKLAILMSFAMVAGVAMADEAKSAAPAKSEAAPAAVKTHDVNVTFVAADATKSTITIKGEDGSEKTVPMEGKALASVKSLKANDKVTITCRDNEKGEHQAITAVKPAAAPAAKK